MSDIYKVKSPCSECPYSRSVKPGGTGGSSSLTYIGQAYGPFWLPCHLDSDFDDPNWKTDYSKAQCAGAAIFRSNIGVVGLMPGFLHKLEANTELVFASPEELLAHHSGVSLEAAKFALRLLPPVVLLELELRKANART